MNNWCGVGKVARDPQVRFEDSGSQVTTFQLSIVEPGRNGETFTLYVGVEAYGRCGEQAAELTSGDIVAVQGKLKYRSYTDKAGQKRSTLCILAQTITVVQPVPVASNN